MQLLGEDTEGHRDGRDGVVAAASMVAEGDDSLGVRKRGASAAVSERRAEPQPKRRTASSSPTRARYKSASGLAAAGPWRGSRIASDYRTLSTLGDIVRMFTGVGRSVVEPQDEGDVREDKAGEGDDKSFL